VVEDSVRIHRHDALLDPMQPSQVLGRRIVSGMPLLAVAGLINTQHKGASSYGLSREPEPNGPQLLCRPVGVGEKMVQGLVIALHRLGEPR